MPKNTLDKNYLWFAEKYGARILPETAAWKIEYLDGIYHVHTKSKFDPRSRIPDPGYQIPDSSSGIWYPASGIYQSKGLVIAGGVLGTLKLLLHQKHIYKTLPGLGDRLGESLRTNSETLCTVTAARTKLNNGVAISSIFKPEKDTWIEIVKYPDGSNLMKTLLTMAVGNTRPVWLRPLRFTGNILIHPWRFLRMLCQRNWAERTVIFLVMQTVDSAMRMTLRKGLFRKQLTIRNDGKKRVNAFIPVGQEVMNRYAEKAGAIPQNSTMEILFNVPSTAHILGGCPMGENSKEGVIDQNFRAFGYPNMYIVDGSVIQGNLGVNPGFTISALAEYTMAMIPENKK
ncbi:MAG: hypothetical protein D4R67_10350 [Bacteroidetes bacterium]|nr:MAG: hypothetical protein D4R67_10350 [Bacteroidota bacterium]